MRRFGLASLLSLFVLGGCSPPKRTNMPSSDDMAHDLGPPHDLSATPDAAASDLSSGAKKDLTSADLKQSATDLASTPPADACVVKTAEITALPPCATKSSMTTVDVKRGCTPTIDGALHAEEWQDAVCFSSVFMDGSVDEVFYMKYAGDKLYFASSGPVQPGGIMHYVFDPTASDGFNDQQFGAGLFDNPFGDGGDGGTYGLSGGKIKGPGPSGIEIHNPPNQPDPIRFEWSIPLSALGIAPGSSHTFSLGYVNEGTPQGESRWPEKFDATKPSSWGRVSSTSQWH